MYKIYTTELNTIIFNSVSNIIIPIDIINPDYIEYLNWISAGNTPENYIQPILVPTVVSMKQAQLALLQSGYLDRVNDAIKSMPKSAQIVWDKSLSVDRSDPMISAMAKIIPLSEQDLDDLFTLAATL